MHMKEIFLNIGYTFYLHLLIYSSNDSYKAYKSQIYELLMLYFHGSNCMYKQLLIL